MTGKGQWDDGSFLRGGDKEAILKQVCLVRDAPSEDLYRKREDKLLEMTSELSVRPGQASNYVRFSDYYKETGLVVLFDGSSVLGKTCRPRGQMTLKLQRGHSLPLRECAKLTLETDHQR